MASTYLSKTYSVAPTSRTTMTISCWVKRSSLSGGTTQAVIGTDGNYEAPITFFTDDTIRITGPYMSAQQGIYITNAVYRDVGAWYHIVTQYDTTNATAADRMKLYVNGERITSFSTQTNSNQNNTTTILLVSGQTSYIGKSGASGYFDGCIADVYVIDGQALTPSSFGQTDATTGIWKPKSYSGSYGTNGFYLKFANSASLGTDSSGNGNNFTVGGGTPTQTLDTPSNVFATINILTCNDTASLTAANGNLTITGGNDMGATIGITKGKWYWESKRSNTGTVAHWGIGFTQSWNSSTQIVTGNGAGYFFRNDFSGGLSVNNSGTNGFTNISTSSTGSSVANGDIIGVALDLDSATKEVTFYQNGNTVASATFSYDGTSSVCFPFIRNNSGAQSQWNFGNGYFGSTAISSPYSDGAGLGKFQYQPPTGYYSLCTKNINVYG